MPNTPLSKDSRLNIRERTAQKLKKILQHLHEDMTTSWEGRKIDLSKLAFSSTTLVTHPRSLKDAHARIDELTALVNEMRDALRPTARLAQNISLYMGGHRGSTLNDSACVLLSGIETTCASCVELYERQEVDDKEKKTRSA